MMSVSETLTAPMTEWNRIATADAGVATAERSALGTTARVVVWPPEALATAVGAVDREVAALDRQASRFRDDSEVSWIHRSPSESFLVSGGLAEAMTVALAAARWTNGLVDPTVGEALVSLGYDRDFAAVESETAAPAGPSRPAPGWSSVRLDGRLLHRPPGVLLDLGATAKGLGSDRAAGAAFLAVGSTGGILVSLGGDIAIAGVCPQGGWPVVVAEDPDRPDDIDAQTVRLTHGAMATSAIGTRRWRRDGRDLHHIVDPRTGAPSTGPWRAVTVAAPNCATANAASTALVVGGEDAEEWLRDTRLPARLVRRDGTVQLMGSWPRAEGAALDIPLVDHLGTGIRVRGGSS